MNILERLKSWLGQRSATEQTSTGNTLRDTVRQNRPRAPAKTANPRQAVPRRQPEFVELDPQVVGKIEDNGPGKNVLVRNKFLREETGTHETLTILDDSIVDSGEETGIDPYNSGRFDRSRNWDKRFRN